ncbi:hypothetical protein IMZ48_02550 [Candidatus Bathyarchaeota archaeon]|nr:hypothetical protein [Candidatus Bathyarchaeota archaeon]
MVITVFDVRTCMPVIFDKLGVDYLAISPNGKALVGKAWRCDLGIFDLETLQLQHAVVGDRMGIQGLTFTSDSLRVIDVRVHQTNVWEPSVLVSQGSESDNRELGDSEEHAGVEPPSPLQHESNRISVLHCYGKHSIAFCGRNNGAVDICHLDDPVNTMRELYRHPRRNQYPGAYAGVTCIHSKSEPSMVVTSDDNGFFRVMQVTTGAMGEWAAELPMEGRVERSRLITQVIIHPSGSLVLVSSIETDYLWSVTRKEKIAEITGRRRQFCNWIHREPSQLVLLEDNDVTFFNWEYLTQRGTRESLL